MFFCWQSFERWTSYTSCFQRQNQTPLLLLTPHFHIFSETPYFSFYFKENSNKKLIQNLSLYIFLIFLIFMIRNPMIHSKINRLTSKEHMFLKTISLKQQSHLNANLARIFCRNWHIYLYIRNPRRSSAKFMVFFFMLIRKKINK